MKRENSFRAWDTLTEAWLNDKISIAMSGAVLFEGKPINSMLGGLEDNIVFMQYIGLKDKSGAKIYESDIIKCSDDDGVIAEYIVEWNRLSAGFVLRKSDNDGCTNRFCIDVDGESVIVVGNLYEKGE